MHVRVKSLKSCVVQVASSGPPPAPRYTVNTPHEEVVLEQLKLFESQAGNPRLQSTNANPRLASFVSDYFFYETLEPPDRCPPCLPSVERLFRWRRGDSFDLSICLASCLLGAGFDAYCVVGTAPRTIATNDQTDSDCPFPRFSEEPSEQAGTSRGACVEATPEQAQPAGGVHIEIPKPLRFEELEQLAEERKQKRKAKEAAFLAPFTSEQGDSEIQKDPFEGCRVHCWVLVRAGARGVASDVFINPSSGLVPLLFQLCKTVKAYTLKSTREQLDLSFSSLDDVSHTQPLYRRLDVRSELQLRSTKMPIIPQLFAKRDLGQNFWVGLVVNMRPKLKAQDVVFSLSNRRFFECALCMPQQPEDSDGPLTDAKADRNKGHLNALLAPRAWGLAVRLSPSDMQNRYFGGQKTIFYKNAKLQEFPPYSQADGLVRSVTFYADPRRKFPDEIRFRFKNRRDGLEERIFWPMARRQVERYRPGNPHALREVVTVHGESRELCFYKSRLDGLVKHLECFGTKISEEFEGRDDGLIAHAVKFREGMEAEEQSETLKVSGSLVCILRVSAKYRRPAEVRPRGFPLQMNNGSALSKLVYWGGGKARLTFHPPRDSIIRPVLYLKRIRSLLQYDGEAVPFCGACGCPPPTETEVARYRKMLKDLVMRFSSVVIPQAEAIHEWQRQQEEAVHLSRKAEEQKLLGKKLWVLRHDEDCTGATRVDKAVGGDNSILLNTLSSAFSGPDDAAGTAGGDAAESLTAAKTATRDSEQPTNQMENKGGEHKYPFCPHGTLEVSLSDAAVYIAYETAPPQPKEQEEEAKPSEYCKQAGALSLLLIDFLAPYMTAYEGREINCAKAEEIAKRAKNDLRLRLMGKAAAIQQQLEEKQEQLKRIKEQMQRKAREAQGEGGEHIDMQEALERHNDLVFRIQILEQRLSRHETQALQKLNDLECAILKDPRLKAMWVLPT
ncbi:hypothetical protein cyc_04413 [Cyclospora cayetanensis]|uniref:Uncharacterized protein n=1 Tax=Cyclospora cayetanensis TaxID=88456 RepID=A0A1D3CY87_9EIME|nr:hypothetical protein cyc_04413 [Cyclospora cayetanensis]